jgi:hypothetical protein
VHLRNVVCHRKLHTTVYQHIYIFIYTYMCVHTYVHIRIYESIHVHMCIYRGIYRSNYIVLWYYTRLLKRRRRRKATRRAPCMPPGPLSRKRPKQPRGRKRWTHAPQTRRPHAPTTAHTNEKCPPPRETTAHTPRTRHRGIPTCVITAAPRVSHELEPKWLHMMLIIIEMIIMFMIKYICECVS